MSRLASLIASKAQRTPDRYYDSTVTVADLSAGATRGRTKEQREAHKFAAIATEWVGFCANINAQACASVPLRLYRRAGRGPKSIKGWGGETRRIKTRPLTRKQQRWQHEYAGSWGKAVSYADGAGDVEEITDHPILDVLRRPNHIQSGTEFDYQLFHSMEITGKAFRHKVVGPGGVPSMFFFMSPLWTKIVPDRDGLIGAFVYGRDGTVEARFEADEVDYFRHRPSLSDPYDGEGPLHDIFQSQSIWLAAHRGEQAWWENSARPDMLVEIDPAKVGPGVQFGKAQADELQARINSSLRGADKRGRFLVVTASKVTPLQFTPKDMEYLQGKTDLKQTILARYGVPESFATLNDANLASATTGHRQYQEMTVLPRVTRRADDETERLVPLFGSEPGEEWIGYDNPVRADETATATRAVSLVGAGIWTINEARAEMEYDPHEDEGADVPRVNGTPLDMVGIPAPPMFGGFGGFGGRDRPAVPAEEVADEPKETEADTEASEREALPKSRATSVGAGDGHVCAAEPVGVRTKDDRAEPAFDRAIDRWLRATLAKVDVGEDGAVAFPADAAERLAEAMTPHWQQAFGRGRESGAGAVGLSGFDVVPERAVEAISRLTGQLAGDILGTETERARAVVARALEQGMTVGEATRLIRADSAYTGARAEAIARTEEAAASTLGQIDAWQEAGAKKRWALSPNACPLCVGFARRFNAAQDAAEPFLKVGDTYEDSTGQPHTVAFRDVQGPPLHPNCTCALEPVLE